MYLPIYLTLLSDSEQALADSYRRVAQEHPHEPEVVYPCQRFTDQASRHVDALAPVIAAYADRWPSGSARARAPEPVTTNPGPLGLLRDLQSLHQLASWIEVTWQLVGQAAAGARDRKLIDVVAASRPDVTSQLSWLGMRMKVAAPQTLLVTS